MSCCASSLYESRPLRASSALPGTPPDQRHRYITHRTALISAPQRGVKGAIAPTAPGREPKNAPAEAGERQSARELRSLLSCFGFAYAADSTSLVACGPQNRLTAVPAPLLAIQKRRLESAPLRSGKGKQASRLARRPKARRSGLRPGVGQGLPVCVACAGF